MRSQSVSLNCPLALMTMSSAYPKHMRSFAVNVLRSSPMTRLHNKGDSTLPCDQAVVVFTSTKVPSLSCYQNLDAVLPTPMYSKASLMASRKVFQKLGTCRHYLFFKDFGMRSISSTRVVSVDLPALYAC